MYLSFAQVYYFGIYPLTLCSSIVNQLAGYLFGFGEKKKKKVCPKSSTHMSKWGEKTSGVILTVKSSPLHDGFGPGGQVLVFSVILCSFASTFVPSMVVGCLFCTCFVRSRKDLLDRQQPTSQVYPSSLHVPLLFEALHYHIDFVHIPFYQKDAHFNYTCHRTSFYVLNLCSQNASPVPKWFCCQRTNAKEN